tara:strand:- start:23 stop:988 length:966 start_codon:yes stop_codon:yes gene_type:complete
MNFRKCISNLYPLIKNDNQIIYIFFIGSYPQREESNHENTKFLKHLYTLGLDVKKIYIDSYYSEEEITITKNRLGDCIIYPFNIKDYEYNYIIEFSHIVGILSNSLTFIFEFTSIDREQFYRKENITPYLFISPFECLGNTNDILYNPLILKNENLLSIYQPMLINNLNEELCNLFNNHINEYFFKLPIITEFLKMQLNNLSNIHRLLLNYIERKDIFDVTYKITFIKKENYFYPSIDALKKRMVGLYYNQSKILIEEFLESNEINFEIFIKKRIQDILFNLLLYKNLRNKEINEIDNDKIIFKNSQDVFKIIEKFKTIFN